MECLGNILETNFRMSSLFQILCQIFIIQATIVILGSLTERIKLRKIPFEIVKKKAYQIQSNPPQVHKVVSKSRQMLMNLISQVGKLKSDGNTTHKLFYLEKIKEDDVGKTQVNYTQSSFSFCLKSEIKQGSFLEKADMRFREYGIKKTC